MGVCLEDLDNEEILRTRQTAIEQRRLSAGTSMNVGDILDRLVLRIDGKVTHAAQMLYGTRFLPDYPQGQLKLGRFRGTKIRRGTNHYAPTPLTMSGSRQFDADPAEPAAAPSPTAPAPAVAAATSTSSREAEQPAE